MGIAMDSLCHQCLMGKYVATARSLGDGATATAFSRELMGYLVQLPPEADSSYMGEFVQSLFTRYYGLEADRYREEKRRSNAFALEKLEAMQKQLRQAEDPLYRALQLSVLGNYIDFSALGNSVSLEYLDTLLEKAETFCLDRAAYAQLRQQLSRAETLLLLCDNAGEIVMDRLLGQTLQQLYPQLKITFCVRGKPVHNDATLEDAAIAGIPFPVIHNGVAVGGTPLDRVCEPCRLAVENSDVVIAKGMGNTETLYGCGHNIFYVFLIKCPRFEEFFQKPYMEPMLLWERQS